MGFWLLFESRGGVLYLSGFLKGQVRLSKTLICLLKKANIKKLQALDGEK
jgi:hypothetical protein